MRTEFLDEKLVVSLAVHACRGNHAQRNATLPREFDSGRIGAVADDNRDLRIQFPRAMLLAIASKLEPRPEIRMPSRI